MIRIIPLKKGELIEPNGNYSFYSSELKKYLHLYFQDGRLTHLCFKKDPKFRGKTLAEKDIAEYLEAISNVLNSREPNNDISVLVSGTPFQLKAWQALTKIPLGKTWSYGKQAEKMGTPEATRAVGSANGKNPVPILIPCHRVIRKSGALGGFSAGLPIKIKLLEIEGFANSKSVEQT
jgi:O-6-methylguanine DNA methyltransferase